MPVNNTLSFIRGTLYAVPAAALCKFLLFPLINGFALLVLTLGCFWVIGIYATTKPRYALQGVAYLIVFNTLASTGLTASYDVGEFANASLATVVALYISLFMFQVFPRTKAASVSALRQVVHHQTLRLLGRHGLQKSDVWQAKQQHRVIMVQAAANKHAVIKTTELARLSIQLARELARLRGTLADLESGTLGVEQANKGLVRIIENRNSLTIAAAQARRTSSALTRLGCHEMANRFADVAKLLSHYQREVHSI